MILRVALGLATLGAALTEAKKAPSFRSGSSSSGPTLTAGIVPGSDIPGVKVNAASVTVSGVSSGADMAQQFHVAWSLTVKGAGLIAPSPYWCAQDQVELALSACMTTPILIDTDELAGIMANTAAWGYIDQLAGLKESRVWIFSATNDSIVNQGVVQKTAQLYSKFLADPTSQMFLDFTHPGEHAQLTNSFGNNCEYLGEPFINACQYDAAGEILTWLYPGQINPLPTIDGSLSKELASIAWNGAASSSSAKDAKEQGKEEEEPALCVLDASKVPAITGRKKSKSKKAGAALPECSASQKAHVQSQQEEINKQKHRLLASSAAGASSAPTPVLRAGNGTLYTFNQGLFVGGGGWSSAVGLAEMAFIFIPDACLQIPPSNNSSTTPVPAGGCLVHVAFHGCEQTIDDINHLFMTGSNYLPHALNSGLVVVFPQAMSNELNPKGCWDWWGYSGPQYASQLGVQNAAIKGVVDSLSGHAVMPPINNNNSGKSLSEFEAKVVSSKSHSKNKRSKGERSRKLAEAAAEAESGNGRALKF